MACHGGRLGGDALLEAAVTGDAEDGVVERGGALGRIRVEQAALVARRHRHADRVGDTLAQRAGGGLHAGGVAVLRVAGGLRAPGAERLQVVQLQAVAGEVELDVEGQAGVARGEDEPVAAGPVRVRRVVPHQLLEEKIGGRGQAHGRTRMAVTDLLHGIHGQDTNGVHRPLVQFVPLEICGGRLGAHPESGLLSTCRMPRTVCPPGGVEPTPASACVFSTLSRSFRRSVGRCGAPCQSLPATTSGPGAFPAGSRNTRLPGTGPVRLLNAGGTGGGTGGP